MSDRTRLWELMKYFILLIGLSSFAYAESPISYPPTVKWEEITRLRKAKHYDSLELTSTKHEKLVTKIYPVGDLLRIKR